jgi:hypothetical protein
MILAFAYFILSAKPISIRRLLLLYVFSSAAVCCVLIILHTAHAATLASQIGIVITLAAWAYPLLCVLLGAFRGHVCLEVFERASICVQATYGLALAIVFTAAIKTFAAPADARSLAELSRLVVVWLAGGIGFALLTSVLRYSPR